MVMTLETARKPTAAANQQEKGKLFSTYKIVNSTDEMIFHLKLLLSLQVPIEIISTLLHPDLIGVF